MPTNHKASLLFNYNAHNERRRVSCNEGVEVKLVEFMVCGHFFHKNDLLKSFFKNRRMSSDDQLNEAKVNNNRLHKYNLLGIPEVFAT